MQRRAEELRTQYTVSGEFTCALHGSIRTRIEDREIEREWGKREKNKKQKEKGTLMSVGPTNTSQMLRWIATTIE